MKKKSIKKTFCIFKEIELVSMPERLPDFYSKSGSSYFYQVEGVYRMSNHWGKAGNSKWRLLPLEQDKNLPNRRKKLGFAGWEEFHEDNSADKLYFIELDFKNEDVHFNHKNNLKENQEVVLRNSLETSKIIKKIRLYFKSGSKFKHFKNETEIENFLLEIISKPTL